MGSAGQQKTPPANRASGVVMWAGRSSVTVGGYPPPAHAKDSPAAVSESLLAVERFAGDLETGSGV
jgi:hypothetical protein